jgi:RimJ/RimL family protein N-acetyltransferase
MPTLIPPHLPAGTIAAREQPALTAAGGLLLRPWKLTDAAAVVAAFSDPDIQRWHVRRADSEAEAGRWITQWQSQWRAETDAQWAIVHAGTGELLGRSSLRDIHLDEGWAECAYWTVPAARGCGVAPRALAALAEWAFDVIGFHRLALAHSTANEASCRVAQKSGFTAEGTQVSAVRHVDGWHDMHVHARVRA